MKKLILPLFLLIFNGGLFAQKLQVNIFGGIACYHGDILSDKSFGKSLTFRNAKLAVQQSKPAYGIGLEYELSNRFSVRGNVTIGKISSDDKISFINYQRNLNFTSGITDGMAAIQYYITDPNENFAGLYLFTGVSFFHFNPYTYDRDNNKVFLQPLSTEGQGFVAGKEPYKLTQFAFPFGGGVKFRITEDLSVGIEASFRKTNTDYLDDVSGSYADENLLVINRGQLAASLAYRGGELNGGTYPKAGTSRGNAQYKDWYYFAGLTASIRLHNNGGMSRSRTGCPTNVY